MIRSQRARIMALMIAIAPVVGVTCPNELIPDRVPNGTWGGTHLGLVVTDTGATIEYDCAAGTITEPLRLDASGNFDWRGIHYPGHGGPVRIDEPPNAHPARYTGHATSQTMSITLTVLDMPAVTPQAFTVTRGGSARVFKCL